jgi:hypothetical protein
MGHCILRCAVYESTHLLFQHNFSASRAFAPSQWHHARGAKGLGPWRTGFPLRVDKSHTKVDPRGYL